MGSLPLQLAVCLPFLAVTVAKAADEASIRNRDVAPSVADGTTQGPTTPDATGVSVGPPNQANGEDRDGAGGLVAVGALRSDPESQFSLRRPRQRIANRDGDEFGTRMNARLASWNEGGFDLSWSALMQEQDDGATGGTGSADGTTHKMDEGELSRQVSNPVSNLWMLFFQHDTTFNDIDGFDDKQVRHNFKFQPVTPITLTNEWRLISRPVFQFNSFDVPQASGEYDTDFGLGDTIWMTVFSNSDPAGEWVYGVGPTWIFPTATEKSLGSRKWSVGPAATAFYLGEKWIAGFVLQNWFSFGGSGDQSVNLMDLQYVLRYRATPTVNIGFGPNVQYDWAEEDWSVPVGLGGDVLVKIGKLPVRFGVEAYYYVDQFDGIDDEWGARFFIIPVVPAPDWAKKPLFGG